MTIRAAIVPAVRDLLEHPMPLVAANVVWGLAALVAWTAWLVSPIAGLAAGVLLAWPTVAVAGVAARVVRQDDVSFRDAFRWSARPAIPVLGTLGVLGLVIALANIAAGLDRGDMAGLAFATAAGWSVVALGVIGCVTWPLLGDPSRADEGVRSGIRLAVTVTLLHTPRVVAASALVLAGLVVSSVLVVALLSVSLSLAALFLCRVVLPLADALDPGPVAARP